jgi:hypothetical protein
MAATTTKQEKEIYLKLNKKKDNSIYEWLDDLKINGTDDKSRVINPLSGSKIFTNKEGVYPIIIKWCFENFKGYDFTGVPNAQSILSVASSPVIAKSPDKDITTIAKEWKDNPTINPLTGATIKVSINPSCEYVALYSKIIDKLVKDILQNKKGAIPQLSIEDCKYIKDSMPNIHAIYHITDINNNIIDSIFYDHLFIAKFIALKKPKTYDNIYSYDTDYLKEIEPYLYLNIYNAIMRSIANSAGAGSNSYSSEYDDVADLLVHIDPVNTNFSISILVNTLCADIKNVLYMHESKVTAEKINKAIYNKEVLKYYIKIYKLTLTNINLREEIVNYYKYTATYNISYNSDRKHQLNNTHYIYYQIANHAYKDTDICKTLLAIYDDILKLYSDNNMKNTIYKYIKDPFNTNKGIEPLPPRKPQLPQDLQKYKMLSSLANAVKNEEKELALKEYQDKENEWKKEFKEYEKKKDIYDRIGKITPKQRIGVWNGSPLKVKTKTYKDDDIIEATKALSAKYNDKVLKAYTTSSHINKDNICSKAPKVSFVKFDKITKTFITNLDIKKHPHDKDKADYYVNDTDPNTQEDFEDMHPNKQKYTCDIVHYDANNREFHFRFDTVNLYNYILKCIEYCEKPKNPITKAELTNENLNEICNKIKYFTKQPTYNTSLDIKAVIDNCKYDNLLAFDYTINYLAQRTSNPIIGHLIIHLNISLGKILFRVINSNKLPHDVTPDNYPNQTNPINSAVLTFPVFADYITDIYDEATYTYPVYILSELQQKLPKGNMIGNRYFPYRKNNANGQQWKSIVNLKKFDLNVLDDADKAFAKLKKYKEDNIDHL